MLDHLGQVLPRAAARWPDATALVVGDRRMTFRELHGLASRVSSALGARGIVPGDRVTLYSGNRWEWIVSYYGVLQAGGVINPINVMLTPEEVAFVVRDCGAKAVIASADKGAPIADVGASSDVEHVICFGADAPPGTVSFEDLLEEGSATREPRSVDPETMSTIGYTSGTTGHPKGAMLSHRTILLNSEMTAAMHMRTARDTVVSALPCAHVYGNVIMNGAFLHGMTLVLHATFDPGAILESIEREKATMFEGVPTMYMYLLEDPRLDDTDLTSLEKCTVGGQTMPVAKMEEVERRFGCPLIELWGMTELGGLGTTHPVYGPSGHGSIGVALPYTEVRVADMDDAGKTVPAGERGELMVRGPLVMMGYYGNEAATKTTIEPDGWLHTGDVAYADELGRVFIVDRKKDMILTAGYNVYPAELERVIAAHPDVAMVAVSSIPDEAKGELAKAFIVAKQGTRPTEADILAHCREHLAAYKVPRAVAFLDDLPKTSTGKILRRELRGR